MPIDVKLPPQSRQKQSFPYETAFRAEAQLHKTCISYHDGLEAQQFFKGQRTTVFPENQYPAPTQYGVSRESLTTR